MIEPGSERQRQSMQVSLADRLEACHSSLVHDVMKDLGLRIRVLPRTVVGLEPWMKVAGPVFTVRGHPDPALDNHTSLFEWAGVLSKSPPGHVVVCQPQDDHSALFGGLSAEALKIKGVLRGYIVDGGCRDIQAIIDQRFPVFAHFATPIDIVGARRAEAFGEPIAIGGDLVQPDDMVLADRNGVILLGSFAAEEVIAAA